MVLPFVRELLADLEHSEAFERVRRHLSGGTGRRRVSGLTFTARALYLPFFVRAANAPCVIVVADNKPAEPPPAAFLSPCELPGAPPAESILRLPAHDVLPFENLSPHPEIQETRAATLWKIATAQARLVIAPVEAACMRLFPRDYYRALTLHLKLGEEYMPDMLVEHLLSVGYTKVDVVEMPGQVTLRGGILDVYSPEMDRPVRIDFFGDEIESIRKFEPESQRSSTPLDEALLLPLTETPVSEKLLAAVPARPSRSRMEASGDDAATDLVTRAVAAGGVTVFPGWEFFAPVAGADRTLFDLFRNPQIFVEEPAMLQNQAERWWNKVEQRHERAGIGGLITAGDNYLEPWGLQGKSAVLPGLELDQLGAVDVLDEDVNAPAEISFPSRPTLRFHGSIPGFIEQLKSLSAQEHRVIIAAPNQGEVERLANMLREYGLAYRLGSRTQHTGSETIYDESSYLGGDMRTPIIVRTAIANGVSFPDAKLVIIGANDLSDDADVAARPVPTRAKSKTAAFVSDFRDLTVGDYVVHVEHGIGRYHGLKEIQQDGLNVEFMVLEFADAARLYVPLTRLDLIQKYRSTDAGPTPVLNKLGGQQWAKTKARVKKAMADMADELLKLYAQRRAAEGHPFPPDNEFQREFEDAFDYNETDDQLSAIADIKRDMESNMPMDRLLCGDVGYGKTEVAMRAAFKAVQDGKQVAVLTPTTVLSFQHYETFRRRFSQFPINIEMISRFRTPKEQKLILEKLEAGQIDILIGTHRLLSKDLKFQDLGLLVVDEEQRFGVRHKERLKQLRQQIDVLSMSATPIPRTLHMSLVGLRDMSVIETPPKDRMAIQTVVAKFDEKLIRTAVELELERGGQIYFVHNRVETIYELAAKIQELVPQSRVVVGHGQIGEAELEKTLLAFMNHEYDVFVATTIIENGIDIPLANTIIVNRADRHGLSELYQLRGRVGRSNRRAYAYLLIPPEQELTDVARRRLAALKEFSDLGAGFKIAALDLELRGAGNMLGGEQSGHIEAVGFEMYTSMLEEAVSKLKGEEKRDHVTAQLNLGISLRIDESYIPEENQRLRVYKKIASAADEATLADVRAELEDRYGALPESVLHLIDAATLRLTSERLGVQQIDRKRDQLHIRFSEKAEVDPGRLMKLVARNAKKGAQFTPQGVLRFPLAGTKPPEVFQEVHALLEQLALEPVTA